MSFARALGGRTYQRVPGITVDPRSSAVEAWCRRHETSSSAHVADLGSAPDADLVDAFVTLYLWVHQRWAPVGDRHALHSVAESLMGDLDRDLGSGAWVDGRLAAIVLVFTDDDGTSEIVAETLVPDEPGGIELLAATVARTLSAAAKRRIAAVSFDGHDDDPHLAPVVAALPATASEPLHLVELPFLYTKSAR